MAKKDPAFLMYSKDWLIGTAEMLPQEKGVYIDLLCYQHQNGSLPIDPVRIAKIVGLPFHEFTEIWKTISAKFQQMDNRMVNQKLNEVMTERKDKGITNTISGTFAAVIRKVDISKKDYQEIRKQFNVDEWRANGTECLTERLTKWLQERLKTLGIGDGNIIVSFCLDKYSKDLQEILKKWIEYKKVRRESYKSQDSFDLMVKNLNQLSGNDNIKALKIIEQSMANNYAGLFEFKEIKVEKKVWVSPTKTPV